MNINNAIKIVESLGVVDVNYKGYPVWIESIDEKNNKVNVKDLDTDKHFTVDVTELKEG